MGIDPAPFWAKLFLYFYEEHMPSLISSDKINARYFHSTKRFNNDICTINHGVEFGRSLCEIYPKKLEHKAKHQGHYAIFEFGYNHQGGNFYIYVT